MNPKNDNNGPGRPGYFLILTLGLVLIGGVALDREDARALAELLYLGKLKEVHHAPWAYRQLREGVRAYRTASRDLSRTKSQLKAFYLFNGVHCAGEKVYASRYREHFIRTVRPVGIGVKSAVRRDSAPEIRVR